MPCPYWRPRRPRALRCPGCAGVAAIGTRAGRGRPRCQGLASRERQEAALDATGWHRDGTTGARLTQRILFGGQALTVRDETGNWAPHDERYLALLVEHGQPCSGNESGLKAFSDAFPTRPVGSITGHISVFNVQEYNKWQQGEGQGKWGGWPGWKKK